MSRALAAAVVSCWLYGCSMLPGERGVPDAAPSSPYAAFEVNTLEEETRLKALADRHPQIDFDALAGPLLTMLPGSEPAPLGRRLWRSAVTSVQNGTRDDRPLYWARLAVREALRESGRTAASFEWSSRGLDDVRFDPAACYRVLITGFDPFGLDTHLDQSNPSGLTVLALDDLLLATARGSAHVQGVVVPVRFADFDAGLIESFLEPVLTGSPPDLVITISMGRDAFDLERFPGRRRSAEVPDNLRVLTGASATRPLVPRLDGRPLEGPEFLEFGLPAEVMRHVVGPFAVRDNRMVRTLERGELRAESLAELKRLTAVAGSGGGYLSNEIGYRTLLLNRRLEAEVPMGHLHTPRIAGHDPELEWQMVGQIRRMIIAAVESLPGRC